jgi:diadenosine tetraphosphate (Ap4A) HIT family hydrolase
MLASPMGALAGTDNWAMSPAPPFDVPAEAEAGCALCQAAGGLPVWQDGDWRVIRAEESDFPAFYRVILRRHVAEWSELSADERLRCMNLVVAVERSLIGLLKPTKVNLAALGNVVPHLHWHVIARFDWDSHFPQPVWGQRQRTSERPAAERLAVDLATLDAAVAAALAAA